MLKVKRSSIVRKRFLARRGLKKTPAGKEVAHKKALALGGKDKLINLMLQKKPTHRKETKILLRKIAKKRSRR